MENKFIICFFAVICCVLSLEVSYAEPLHVPIPIQGGYLEAPLLPQLVRKARSPEGGSVQGTYTQDANGRQAEIQYNHNLFTSKDGRGSVDAYANAQRNFDQNRNNYGGGIQGKWRF